MERGRLISLRNRLNRGDTESVLKELLSSEPFEIPEEILSGILNILSSERTTHLRFDIAVEFILKTRDERVYRSLKTNCSILQNHYTCYQLLEAGIPDAEIEQRVVSSLESGLGPTGTVHSRLEALRDHGSVAVLDALLAIEYNYFSRFKLAQVLKGTTDSVLHGILNDYEVSTGNLLKDTINCIRNRGSEPSNEWGVIASLENPLIAPFTSFAKHKENAERHFSENDTGASLNYIRKALEALLKAVIKSEEIQPRDKKPIDQLLLPQLIGAIMDAGNSRRPDKYIFGYITNLQNKSTLGSHDQPVVLEETLTNEMLRGLLVELGHCGRYFQHYIEDKNVGEKG